MQFIIRNYHYIRNNNENRDTFKNIRKVTKYNFIKYNLNIYGINTS